MNSVNPNNNLKVENNYEDSQKLKKMKRCESAKRLSDLATTTNANQKSNIKNTYINKINSLISDPKLGLNSEDDKAMKIDDNQSDDRESSFIKQENSDIFSGNYKMSLGFKKVRSYDVLRSDDMEKINVKLARNRESARNSRKRKKIYIDLLERKVDQLTKELDTTKKQLDLNTDNLNKICFKSKLMNTLINGRMQLFERLEKMLNGKVDETEINLLIDSLRLRLGANGKERVEAINYFFKQIIEILIPVHMKYLLWVASEGKDLFNHPQTHINNSMGNLSSPSENDIDNNGYWNELLTQVSLTQPQKKNIVKYRKKLIQEKQKFVGLINGLNVTRKAILKQANSLQNVIDDFRNILSPVQVAKFLTMLDKERNRKEFTAEKLWSLNKPKKENEIGDSEESDHFLDDVDRNSQADDESSNNGNSAIDLMNIPEFNLDFSKESDPFSKKGNNRM